MIMTLHPDFSITAGVEQCLVEHARLCGPITSLDAWAHRWGIDPDWVRRCAHRAADKGILRLERLSKLPGRPYRVSSLEERHHEE